MEKGLTLKRKQKNVVKISTYKTWQYQQFTRNLVISLLFMERLDSQFAINLLCILFRNVNRFHSNGFTSKHFKFTMQNEFPCTNGDLH